MNTTGIKGHLKGDGSGDPMDKGRQTAVRFISMEESTLSSEKKWGDCGVHQAEVSPAPTAGFTEGQCKDMESSAGTELLSPAALKTAFSQGLNSASLAMGTNPSSPEVCSSKSNEQPSPASSLADMDCLVCFNKYNIYRLPKLLGCQHAFCAVCLKLILRKEENAWIITCPLCRKNTSVSGGLIRTLPNKEEIMELLEHPDSCIEVHGSGIGLDSSSWAQSSQDILNREQTVPADNRLAVQRLVLLLLLLVILTILILPFIYSGMIKWVICIMLTLGLLMSMVLCCTPKFYWSCNGSSLRSCHKETHIAAIA